MSIKNLLYVIILSFVINSCSLQKRIIINKNNKFVSSTILGNPIFKEEFVGFVLYDPLEKKDLININGNKLFTPASNNKLLTFKTIYPVLSNNNENETLPLLYYVESTDSIHFWGAGNPTLLNNQYEGDEGLLASFFSQDKTYVYCQSKYQETHYGEGWMWDDAPYSFQKERSDLPLYGNALKIEKSEPNYIVSPSVATNIDTSINRPRLIYNNDSVFINLNTKMGRNSYEIPYHVSTKFTIYLLNQKFDKTIITSNQERPSSYQTIYSQIPLDTLYKEILVKSDNFITEQLMMMANMAEKDTLSVSQFIKSHKSEISSNLRWADASGISRYNLVSPKTIIKVLVRIKEEIGMDKVSKLFPVSGHSGTIKNWYGGYDKPYIWAKTGTLSNNHNISGYLQTDSGQLLIFSFMNNHYLGSSSIRKIEMEKVFKLIKERY